MSDSKVEPAECCECGDPVDFDEYVLDSGEKEIVFSKDPSGNPICDSCLHEIYPICGVCQDNHVWNPRKIGGLFIVTDDYDLECGTGTFEILEHPFYWHDGIGGGDLFLDAIRLITTNTYGAGEGHEWPDATHVACDDCAKMIKEQADE